jgi:formylglycine-generating enzyme required for sulfatase activity
VGGSVRRRFAAAAASILVLGAVLLAASCGNPLTWTLGKWSTMYDDMVTVDGGTLILGDTEGSFGYLNEYPTHQVLISTFLISRFEVTQGLYEQVMGMNPSYFTSANGYTDNPDLPVECVTWLDAVKFCNQFSEAMGLQPCYFIDESVPGDENVTCDFTMNGYRLPTEAEWEYAARGGTSSNGYLFAGSSTPGDVAWYDSNSGGKTQPVGQLAPNELGLYDMSGNVWEFVWDGCSLAGDYNYLYDAPYYGTEPYVDPHGPFVASNDKVWLNDYFMIRGGGWWEFGSWAGDYERVSARTYFLNAGAASPPSSSSPYYYYDTGFRVVRNQ